MKKVRPLRLLEAMFVAWLTASVFFWAPTIFDTGCKNDLAANTVSCVAHFNGTATDQTFTNGCIDSDEYYCPTESQIDTSMDHCQSVEDEEYAQYTCSEGKHNQLATLTFQTQEKAIKSFFHNQADFGSSVLIVYFFLYFALAVFTYGISVPSGLFVPGILIGCAYGRLIGEALRNSFDDIHPGTYALIGATSMLGGCTRMTISLTVILLETTNDIQYLLPIMMVLMISKWVGDFFNISLYDMHVELKCIPFVEALPPRIMEHMHVKEVMSTDVVLFQAITSVQHVVDVLKSNEYNGFPVVNEKKKFIGLILRSQLIVLINKKAYITEAQKDIVKNDADPRASREKEMGYVRGERGPLKISDFGTEINFVQHPDIILPQLETESYDSLYLDLRPYMNPAPFSIQENTPLARVFRLYRSMGIRHLPVVDDENTVVGILTRKELRTDFSTDLY